MITDQQQTPPDRFRGLPMHRSKQGSVVGLGRSDLLCSASNLISNDNEPRIQAVDSLPALLNLPLQPSPTDSTQGSEPKQQLNMVASKDEPPVIFVASNDVPKRGNRDARFHRIRESIKLEETNMGDSTIGFQDTAMTDITQAHRNLKVSNMYRQSVGQETDEETENEQCQGASAEMQNHRPILKACEDCRARKRRCLHGLASPKKSSKVVSTHMQRRFKIKTDTGPAVKTEAGAGRAKKDGTPYVRIPHDRSNGPSMTPSAVDYRQRKVIQEEYRVRLGALLDADIVQKVDDEGGITPEGRLYKACVRMLERVHAERNDQNESAGVGNTVDGVAWTKAQQATVPNQFDTLLADQRLADFKQKLQTLINEGV